MTEEEKDKMKASKLYLAYAMYFEDKQDAIDYKDTIDRLYKYEKLTMGDSHTGTISIHAILNNCSTFQDIIMTLYELKRKGFSQGN